MDNKFKNRVREQFGKTALAYVQAAHFSGGEDLEEAARLLQPTQEDNLLDVACGGGHTALFFAPMVRQVVASDLTMQMLKKAQEHLAEEGGVDNVIFREADAEDLPFPAGSFTLLTCRIAPHHFPDVPQALREFHRVLRRGGRMVIIDTLLPSDPEIAEFYQTMEQMRDPTHIRAFNEETWRNMILDAELILHETKIIPKTHDFQEWAKRAGLNRKEIQELNKFFMEAPQKVHDYFKIESFAGEVETYTDQKLLIYACRKEKEKK
ncbi:class I SAM-dependent methyltransferase [Malonomonas rubra]|uniref:class I SAM-dependent methyltransferase n=1 Tax=Malonomonas rubra TaxID=57040 RepID=UPI0026F16C5F|nr:methyltransferase domain-containing protein [Malonomonas rubra]